jgi:hypothetical protein
MMWIVEHVGNAALFDYFAGIHHGHTVADFRYHAEVVRDK